MVLFKLVLTKRKDKQICALSYLVAISWKLWWITQWLNYTGIIFLLCLLSVLHTIKSCSHRNCATNTPYKTIRFSRESSHLICSFQDFSHDIKWFNETLLVCHILLMHVVISFLTVRILVVLSLDKRMLKLINLWYTLIIWVRLRLSIVN